MNDEFLNEDERERVMAFCADEKMKNAVKKVLLAGIYDHGTLKAGEPANGSKNFILAIANNRTLNNEQLGAAVQAAVEGIATVENAFKKLESYKPAEKAVEETNPAL